MKKSECKVIGVFSKAYGYHSISVDFEDYDLVSKYSWQIQKHGRTYYALTAIRNENGNHSTMRMHRLLLQDKLKENDKLVVDHINGNGLDNRRCNLRAVTQSTNMRNTRTFCTNTSGVSGVKYDPTHNRWVATIYKDGKQYCKYYKVATYGDTQAKEMAVKQRKDWESELGYISR